VSTHYQPSGRTAAELAASIEKAVREGRLSPGELLSPVRDLARRAKVSTGTAASAYRLLKARGITLSDGRRGTRVRDRLVTTGRAADAADVPPGVVDCSTGNPDPDLLPPIGPALERIDTTPVLYGAPPCLPALAAAARARLTGDGVPVEAVTATFGTLDAIGRILAAELRPGDRIAVEDPGWASLLDLVTAGGWVPAPVAVDDEGPTPSALARALTRGTRAFVLTSRAQNPIGASLTGERATELKRILRAHPDVVVIEDDHGFGIARDALQPLVGTTSRWAFIRSAAKAYGPDLRLAVVAGDEATVRGIEGRLALGAGWPSHLLQRVLLELWSDPTTGAALERAVTTYDARRNALLEALGRRDIHAMGRSGLNCWIPVDDEAATVGALLRSGWLVAPGSRFRLGAPPAVRVTTAALPVDQAGELASAIAPLPGTSRTRRLT
jgi:DNA-binding transcriptional MocR family regulator